MYTKKVRLYGLLPPDFVVTSERLSLDIKRPDAYMSAPRDVIAHDARILQAKADTPAAFFAQHGFVLLNAPTAVTDWSKDSGQVETTYFAEVEKTLRETLFPNTRDVQITQIMEAFMRRGAGTSNQTYATSVHQDYGWTAADFEETITAFSTPEMACNWRTQYEKDHTLGFAVINFWRTTAMKLPLEHMPLILADPTTVHTADLVPCNFAGITPTGKDNNQMMLRYNPAQKWYWYPQMRPNEVLVFKVFECSKRDDTPIWRSVFHSAFEDPDADVDAEQRQSCEHRAQVTFFG